jgi:hypothetical protein
VWAAAREHGLTPRTVNRAKEDLEVRSQPLWVRGVQHSHWLLPHQDLPAPEADSDTPELDAPLAAREAQYPSVCPLDEQ